MRKIIIAPTNYHALLRKRLLGVDVFSDVKFISLEQLLDKYFGKVNNEYAFVLMDKYCFNYGFSKRLISYLPYLKDHPKYGAIYQDAINSGYLEKDEYLPIYLDGVVEVYGYRQDNRLLNYVFRKLNISREYKSLDLIESKHPLYLLNTVGEEVRFVLNKIQSLFAKGVSPDDIYLFGLNEDSKIYFSRYAKDYDVFLNNLSILSLDKSDYFKTFINAYKKDKNVDDAKEALVSQYPETEIKDVIDFINNFSIDTLTYEQQLDVFLHEAKCLNLDYTQYTNAINILLTPKLMTGKHIFVLDFNSSSYPRCLLDNDIISDECKKQYNIFTSLEKNQIEKDKLISFFKTDNSFYFCFAKKHMNNIYYLSFLKDDMSLDTYEINIFDNDCSNNSINLTYGRLKDTEYKYNEKHPLLHSYSELGIKGYRSYDNSFKPFAAIKETDIINISYSKYNSYSSCPFHYYLNYVLGVKDQIKEHLLDIGTFVHCVFEKAFSNPNDFDKIFDDKVLEMELDDKQKIFLNNLKQTLHTTFINYYNHYLSMANPAIYLEKKINFKLTENTYVKGVIDKAIITNNKYLFLFDYKTSKNDLNMNSIINRETMQLPFYALLSSKDNSLSNYKIYGLYYQNVLPEKINFCDEEGILTYSKSKGLTVQNIEAISSLEKDFMSDNIVYTKITKLSNDGSFPSDKNYIEEKDIENIIDIATEEFLNFEHSLRNNNFKINPVTIKDKIACKRCPNKDICFRRTNVLEVEEENGLV